MDSIHYNPVKHSMVKRVIDWAFFSFHRYVRLGWLSPGWGEQRQKLAKESSGNSFWLALRSIQATALDAGIEYNSRQSG